MDTDRDTGMWQWCSWRTLAQRRPCLSRTGAGTAARWSRWRRAPALCTPACTANSTESLCHPTGQHPPQSPTANGSGLTHTSAFQPLLLKPRQARTLHSLQTAIVLVTINLNFSTSRFPPSCCTGKMGNLTMYFFPPLHNGLWKTTMWSLYRQSDTKMCEILTNQNFLSQSSSNRAFLVIYYHYQQYITKHADNLIDKFFLLFTFLINFSTIWTTCL